MKDLDFDELDKAVSALSAQAKPSEPPKPATSEPQVPIQSGPPEAEKPVEPVAVSSVAVKTPLPQVTPARRGARLGVKPVPTTRSSAVRNTGGAFDIVAPPKRVSRSGQPVKPPTPVQPVDPADDLPAPKPRETIVSSAPKVTQTQQEPVAAPAQTPAAAPPEPTVKPEEFMADHGHEAWPDPLDFFKPENEEHNDKPQPSKEQQALTDEKPSSPFIEGAKVEKRPLGAFAAAAPSPVVEPKSPVSAEQLLQEEPSKPPAGVAPKPEAEPKPVDEDHLLPPHFEGSAPAEPKPLAQTVRENATLAIPQQYKTAPKETNKTEHSLFDTKEYHPPLLEDTAHAKKRKKLGWLKWLITVIVLGLLGAGAYFAFGYILQQSNL